MAGGSAGEGRGRQTGNGRFVADLLLLMLLHCFCCGVWFVNMGVFFF